jgi:hypothetical protein
LGALSPSIKVAMNTERGGKGKKKKKKKKK